MGSNGTLPASLPSACAAVDSAKSVPSATDRTRGRDGSAWPAPATSPDSNVREAMGRSARGAAAAGLILALTLPAAAWAQHDQPLIPDPSGVQDEAPPPGYAGPLYTRQELMIPVRDGIKLHTV